jgi:myo-inositol-1(or 4)-monophosphatase
VYQKELELLKEVVPRIYEDATKIKKEIAYKDGNEVVTTIDLYIEEKVIDAVLKAFPNDTFLSEEFHKDGILQNRTWLIDPIDGTSNFSVELDLFVIQIALYDQGDFVLSYIYHPRNKNTYVAIKNKGAYLNGERYHLKDIKCNRHVLMSLVGVTTKDKEKSYYHKLIDYGMANQTKLRILGSIGLELSLASEGILNVFYSGVTNLWDIAPGLLLCREAGAHIFNEHGLDYKLNDNHLFVTDNEIRKNLIIDILQLK